MKKNVAVAMTAIGLAVLATQRKRRAASRFTGSLITAWLTKTAAARWVKPRAAIRR